MNLSLVIQSCGAEAWRGRRKKKQWGCSPGSIACELDVQHGRGDWATGLGSLALRKYPVSCAAWRRKIEPEKEPWKGWPRGAFGWKLTPPSCFGWNGSCEETPASPLQGPWQWRGLEQKKLWCSFLLLLWIPFELKCLASVILNSHTPNRILPGTSLDIP